MKTKRFLFILFFITFCIIGCASSLRPVTYSFAENDSENGSAKITFVGSGDDVGVRFVDYEGIEKPDPAEGTRWESAVIFPAEKSLNIRVYVFWDEDRFGERRKGIFRCPPLKAGKKYNLKFIGDYKNGGVLLLTDENNDSLVYKQEIPPYL